MKFNSYRLFLLTQTNLFATDRHKNDVLKEVVENLINENKIAFVARKNRFVIYYNETLAENIFLFQLAREQYEEAPFEGEKKIETRLILKLPSVYIILDAKRQIVLIEEKTSVFQDSDVSSKRLQQFLEIRFREYYLSPSIDAISDKDDFWGEIGEMESIEEFDITLRSPNLFGARQQAEDLMKEVQEETNAEEIEIKLRNTIGQLQLSAEMLGQFISYVASGAGKYVVKGLKKGKWFVLKSYDKIIYKSYDVDDPREIDSEKLNEDLKDINELNDKK